MAETALITGASYGIGYELAKLFARDHVNLFITARSQDKLTLVKEELQSEYHITVNCFPCDLTKPETVEALYQATRDKEITIDYLINNAGFGLLGAFNENPWEKEATMIDLNIRALTHLTKLFLPDMENQNHGKILNVASLAAFQPGPLMAVYYATKHYVLAFSEGLAEELSGTGISVTTLCPGPVKTGFPEKAEMGDSRLFRLPGVKNPDQVADYAYKQMKRGKRIAVPGFNNQLSAFLVRFLPSKWLAKVAKQLHKD